MKPLVYIAGPYTIPDPVINTRRAIGIADQLVAAGAAVIVPHLTMLWHLVSPRPAEDWYAIDLDVLAHCDFLVRFAGASAGADREIAFAESNGILWHQLPADDSVDYFAALISVIPDRQDLALMSDRIARQVVCPGCDRFADVKPDVPA